MPSGLAVKRERACRNRGGRGAISCEIQGADMGNQFLGPGEGKRKRGGRRKR